ncbi:MAG: GNAT family N-acetyltransferase, partial [Pyrinomonadaceae bacterium]
MENSVRVKPFELAEKNALLSFLQAAYPDAPRQSDPRFWEWHFLESPYVTPDKMPVWVVKNGEQIIGQLAAIPVELKVGGVQTRAMWILDFIVHHDYRGRGLGKRLVRAAEEFCPLCLGVNTNEQTAPLLLKSLGWVIVGKIPRYSKLLFPGNALREVSQFKPLRQLINLCYAPLRPQLAERAANEDDRLQNVEQFDSSFDTLWQEASGQWPCAVVRDSGMLKWQYTQQPGKQFDVLGFYENNRLVGYVVLFFRKTDEHGALPKAAITDLFYHPDKPLEIVDGLLQGALRMAVKRRAGALVTDVIDPLVEERLQH